MKLLVDTQLLLWAMISPKRLSRAASARLMAAENDLFFSAASLWEVAIKRSLGRADFDVEPGLLRQELLNSGYTELPVTGLHALALGALPPLHKDPFDRILVAQVHAEGMTLLTADRMIARYPGSIQRI